LEVRLDFIQEKIRWGLTGVPAWGNVRRSDFIEGKKK